MGLILSIENTIQAYNSNNLLLDRFAEGVAAAYSLRQLSTTYTGDAIRVRRASDNTEQDIGFVGGELDTASLTTFCSATDGFVTTWYDQSGNGYDVTQATAANQPQIVSSGSVILENSKPCIQFDGVNDVLNASTTTFISGLNASFSAIAVSYIDNNGTNERPFCLSQGGGSSNFFNFVTLSVDILSFQLIAGNNKSLDIGSILPLGQKLIAFYSNGTTANAKLNNISVTNMDVNNSSALSFNFISIGALNNFGFDDIKCSEFIVYPTDQNSNGGNIETNINDFYSIY